MTVSKLDQPDQQLLNPRNVFNAERLRRIAEITQAALVERNQIEREAEARSAHNRLRLRRELD